MPSRAARSLVARLAINRGARLPRERLATLFWPDLPPNRARRRLSHTLWQVQDTLTELDADVSYLEVTAETLAIPTDAPCTVDVELFEAGLDRARSRRGTSVNRLRDLTDLEATIELYRGEFLAGHTEDWVAAEQERLHQRYVEALGWLVGLAKSHGAYDDALVYARRLTNEEPLREDGHREVMRLSVLLGRTSEAIRQYERCREVLAEEIGTEPSAATTELHRRIVRRRRLTPSPSEPERVAMPDRVPLVGRDRERDLAVAVLERALTSRGGAVLVEGEPGIGTSRLLDEVVDDAHWRSFTTAQAVCPRPEQAIPYGVVQDLLDGSLTALKVEQLRARVAPVWLVEASKLIPVLSRAVPEDTVGPSALRLGENAQRMRDALTEILVAMAGIDPLALVVDDLHWSDVESLSVLEAVAERAGDHRVVLVVGYRGEDARAADEVWRVIRNIDRHARPERLVLGPLDPFSSGELIRLLARGQSVGPAVIGRLQRETGGNPLFLVETVRALAEDDELATLEAAEEGTDELSELPLPGSIRALALHRLERLTPETRAVLDVAAVAGGELDLEVLTAACDLPREVVVDAADALVRKGLLTQSKESIAFRHDQVRRAAVDVLRPAAREVLHARIADGLEEHQPDAVERLAHHCLEGDQPQRAITYLRQAGHNAVAVHAYVSAERHYRAAVELMNRVPVSVAARFELLAKHEEVLEVLGERERQRALLDELAVLADGVGTREVEVSRRRALLYGHLGDLQAAQDAAAEAVAGAQLVDGARLLGPALVAQASVLTWAGQRGEAVPVLRRAVEMAADPVVAVQAQVQLGSVLRELQHYDEATTVLHHVLDVAATQGVLREEAIALGVLGAVQMETGDTEAAVELYSRAIDRSIAIGFRRGEGVNLLNRAVARSMRSELGDALCDYEQATQVFTGLHDRRGEAMVRFNLAFTRHAVLGDDVTAGEQATRAMAFFAEIDDHPMVAQCLDTLAGIALRAGELAQASAHVESALAAVPGAEDRWVRIQLLRRRAEVALADHDPARALETADEAIATARELGLRDLLPPLLGLRGEALLELSRPHEALVATTSASEDLHPGVDRPYLVQLQHALALAAVGRDGDAAEAARASRDQLLTVLDSVDEGVRSHALEVPEHRRIHETVERLQPRLVTVSVARAAAPLGRPLEATELIEVTVPSGPTHDEPADPAQARRARLVRVVEAIRAQGGAPTVGDLAQVLEVSSATVRRDLGVLRDEGTHVVTRGHRTGWAQGRLG